MSVVLGKTYRDKVTGFEGIATHKTQFLYACERVCLQAQAKEGEIKEGVFDEPQLELVAKGKVVKVEPEKLARTGGVRPGATRARSNAR